MDLYIVIDNSSSIAFSKDKINQFEELAVSIVDSINKKDVYVHLVGLTIKCPYNT